MSSPATAKLSSLRIAFGPDQSGIFEAGLPVLAGETLENLFRTASAAGTIGALTLFRTEDWLLGAASVAVIDGLEAASHQLYLDIFRAAQGLQLARIWNYVPAINEIGADGLENYRLFCRGRSLAFEEHHGADFKALLPSASAVGCGSETITVSFAASTRIPRHIENPLQVPAYDYPADYGPRAPSFARASVVAGLDGVATVFISGTAAIRGHATVAPNDLRGQLDCTVENLREISAACGLGPYLDRRGNSQRHFKVYVRNAADQPAIAVRLEKEFFKPGDHVSYLQADICREPLLVEIEATLLGVGV
jgi:hypothetical protein